MDFRSIFLPYCLIRQEDGRYAVVNRRYKPVGFNTKDWVNYEDYPILTEFSRLGPATAAGISFNGSDDQERIYLYNDGCIPTDSDANMADYLNRLKKLASLAVK